MDITRTASGAIKITSSGGSIYFLINLQNVKVSYTDNTATITLLGYNYYDFPIVGLTINGVAFAGTAMQAADAIANTILTKA